MDWDWRYKNIKLNALPVYGERYMKTKIRKYGDKVYTNFCGLNVPEDNIQCEYFTVISIDSLLAGHHKQKCKKTTRQIKFSVVTIKQWIKLALQCSLCK